jgi:hypothetical protein
VIETSKLSNAYLKEILYYPNAVEYAIFGWAKWTKEVKGEERAFIY